MAIPAVESRTIAFHETTIIIVTIITIIIPSYEHYNQVAKLR